MTDVELTTKEWKRVLGWYSWFAKKTKAVDADEQLKKKINSNVSQVSLHETN